MLRLSKYFDNSAKCWPGIYNDFDLVEDRNQKMDEQYNKRISCDTAEGK
jgi:plasmid maintenance system antidote protein VapI